MKPTLEVTSDFTKEFNEVIKGFKRDLVLVGIPQDKSERGDDAPINNATILAVNEFGSPLNNIPPRPAMKFGIQNAQKEIAEEFKKAAIKALSQGLPAVALYYERAGSIAASSVKQAINSQEGFDPLAESTLAAREAAGFKGTKALIVTGQLRNSITYVVKEGL